MARTASEMAGARSAAASAEPGFGDFVLLLKPRVMSLVVFTALAGLLAPGAPLPAAVAVASLVCIALGAGAAGALNMWFDADIDALMRRTRARPVPAGVVTPGEALGLGLGLAVLSVMMLAVFANPLAAALLAFTIFFYAVVYTMWLKRRTAQNIVIGGAAGALPPVVAWAAATGEVGLPALLMFLLIFLWTPPHFWALALFRNDDYTRARVPMMPVVAGGRATRRQILLYALALVPASLALGLSEAGGAVYLAVAFAANVVFVAGAWRVARRDDAAAGEDGWRAEKRLFGHSILYLFALFAALIVEAVLSAAELAPGGLALAWPTGL